MDTPAQENNPFAEVQGEQTPAPAPEHVEQPVQETQEQEIHDVDHDVQELEPAAEQAVEEFVHTHESVLSDLMTKLEGIAHMSASEVRAIVESARNLFHQL